MPKPDVTEDFDYEFTGEGVEVKKNRYPATTELIIAALKENPDGLRKSELRRIFREERGQAIAFRIFQEVIDYLEREGFVAVMEDRVVPNSTIPS